MNATETANHTIQATAATVGQPRPLRKGEKFGWYKQLPSMKHFDASDFAVALAIANRTDELGKSAYHSIDTLAEETGWSRSTVIRSTKSVIASGLIAKVKVGGGRNSNHFELRMIDREPAASVGKVDVTIDEETSSVTRDTPAVSRVTSESVTSDTRTDPFNQIKEPDLLLHSSETSIGGDDKHSSTRVEASTKPAAKPKRPLDPRGLLTKFHYSNARDNHVDIEEALNKFCWQHARLRSANWGGKFGQYIKAFAVDREEVEFHVPADDYVEDFDYVGELASVRADEDRHRVQVER